MVDAEWMNQDAESKKRTEGESGLEDGTPGSEDRSVVCAVWCCDCDYGLQTIVPHDRRTWPGGGTVRNTAHWFVEEDSKTSRGGRLEPDSMICYCCDFMDCKRLSDTVDVARRECGEKHRPLVH